MKFHRIKAIVIRNLYLYKRSAPRIFDMTFWPILDILLWGFLSLYLKSYDLSGVNIVSILLGAVIFWELVNNSQKAVSIAFLEEVWERNFLNIFVTPISMKEFLFSTFLIGLIRLVLVSIIMGVLTFLIYGFNMLSLGFLIIPFVANLLLFGSILGILVIGIILRYGTSAQILAWGIIAVIQPFSAVFYPVSVLPVWAQNISSFIPTTYVFEGMRSALASNIFSGNDLVWATSLNIFYLTIVLIFFFAMFKKVKKMGKLLKLD